MQHKLLAFAEAPVPLVGMLDLIDHVKTVVHPNAGCQQVSVGLPASCTQEGVPVEAVSAFRHAVNSSW